MRERDDWLKETEHYNNGSEATILQPPEEWSAYMVHGQPDVER